MYGLTRVTLRVQAVKLESREGVRLLLLPRLEWRSHFRTGGSPRPHPHYCR